MSLQMQTPKRYWEDFTPGLVIELMADGFVLNSSSMGAPGVEEVQWLKPIRPGDELTLRATVLSTRTSKSWPEMGFVNTQMEMRNAAGERVMALKAPLMFGRRSPGGDGA
jgi:acyl dehydratase